MRVAVVSGANKGIGLAIVKGLCQQFDGIVYLTARNEEFGRLAVIDVKKEIPKMHCVDLRFHQLDITHKESIVELKNYLLAKHGGLDVLVNNAGVANEYETAANKPTTPEESKRIIMTNFFGTLDVCEQLFPILRPHGRVVHISSTLGMLRFLGDEQLKSRYLDESLTLEELIQLQEQFIAREHSGDKVLMNTGFAAYAYSKIGVTKLGFIQQEQFNQDPRADLVVNSCCPGFVATALNSNKGTLTTEEGAKTPVYLALLPHNVAEPKGKFVRQLAVVDWNASQQS